MLPIPFFPAVWLLLACVLVQLFYFAYYFLPFANRPSDPAAAEPGPDDESVSVLVCARNELENLRRLLPLLLRQDYPAGFEIVLINDRSDDDTYGYVQQLTQHCPHVQLVEVRHTPDGFAPKKHALTLGIKTARYPRLLFTDADCIPATNQWIRLMQRGFAQPAEMVLGYSAYVPAPGLLNKLIRFETLVTGAQYLSFAWRGKPYMGVGRNLAYTRQTFRSTKGFASHMHGLSGDDDLLVQDAVAQGARVAVVAESSARTLSEPAASWGAWWRQKRRHLSAGKRYRLADRWRVGNFIGTNLLFYFTCFALLFSRPYWIPLAVLWSLRTGVMLLAYQRLARRLNDRLPLALLPLLDAIYSFYYLALGISLFLHRTLRWK